MTTSRVYECFLDDSKDQRQEFVYTCAGFVGPSHAWARFQVEWDAALKLEGIAYWKTSESKALDGEFKKYRDLDRVHVNEAIRAMKLRLMAVLLRHRRLVGIAVSIPVDVYKEIMSHPSAPLVFKETELYDRAFTGLITKVAEVQEDGFVDFIHDDGPDFDHLRRVYNSYVAKLPTLSERMRGFAPLNDKLAPPLQVADMLANSVMGRHRDLLNGAEVSRSDVDFNEVTNIFTWDREFGLSSLAIELMDCGLPVPADLYEETREIFRRNKPSS